VKPSGVRSEIQSEENQDRIRDAILAELGNATYDDLHAPEGREKVKGKIISRVNEFLYQGEVLEVYFGEFILQAMSGYGKK
jgi:flagellar FliL protein